MRLVRLAPDAHRPAFTCGNDDLDEFYRVDSIEFCRQLVSVTYAYVDDRDPSKIVAFFSVSNDSIKKEDLSASGWRRAFRLVPRPKQYKSMPAVKIGRLGVASDSQGQSHGTKILDYIKVWFTDGNKTGCRFLLVDAYNGERTLKFYERNGFQFLTKNDENEETRIMYFDLLTFKE